MSDLGDQPAGADGHAEIARLRASVESLERRLADGLGQHPAGRMSKAHQ